MREMRGGNRCSNKWSNNRIFNFNRNRENWKVVKLRWEGKCLKKKSKSQMTQSWTYLPVPRLNQRVKRNRMQFLMMNLVKTPILINSSQELLMFYRIWRSKKILTPLSVKPLPSASHLNLVPLTPNVKYASNGWRKNNRDNSRLRWI